MVLTQDDLSRLSDAITASKSTGNPGKLSRTRNGMYYRVEFDLHRGVWIIEVTNEDGHLI